MSFLYHFKNSKNVFFFKFYITLIIYVHNKTFYYLNKDLYYIYLLTKNVIALHR